ncbi:hypothetical protein VPHG_00181 [Vibrio phage 11895-B1]|uniref:hypothetical protein n=1 Tax=Vibrio phage 11895-B1 TaxID=754075 RepID=UPI0002C1295C|nr:hypothetical protein VPHG_00181 [Vibrio phage 11895-B1]AGH32244.1 hypothetical protein VPHG_00181 [Vibrio phage 11895-B1]
MGTGYQKGRFVLADREYGDKVYGNFYSPNREDVTEAVDEFIDRMLGNTHVYNPSRWLVSDDEMFTDLFLYPSDVDYYNTCYVDMDDIHDIVNRVIENMMGDNYD